jgi:hypothetical protein
MRAASSEPFTLQGPPLLAQPARSLPIHDNYNGEVLQRDIPTVLAASPLVFGRLSLENRNWHRGRATVTDQFDVRQRNNLRVGNALAAEISASSPGRRAFAIVTSYHDVPRLTADLADHLWHLQRRRFSKVLNTGREFDEDERFACTVVKPTFRTTA